MVWYFNVLIITQAWWLNVVITDIYMKGEQYRNYSYRNSYCDGCMVFIHSIYECSWVVSILKESGKSYKNPQLETATKNGNQLVSVMFLLSMWSWWANMPWLWYNHMWPLFGRLDHQMNFFQTSISIKFRWSLFIKIQLTTIILCKIKCEPFFLESII